MSHPEKPQGDTEPSDTGDGKDPRAPGTTYVVTAYRWGQTNGHQYTVYAGTDRAEAMRLAEHEPDYRGGKYGCEVVGHGAVNEHDQESARIAYFPSILDDADGPHTNHRLDMLQTIGAAAERGAEGTRVERIPHEGGGFWHKPVPAEPLPEWLMGEVWLAHEQCAMWERVDRDVREKRKAKQMEEG